MSLIVELHYGYLRLMPPAATDRKCLGQALELLRAEMCQAQGKNAGAFHAVGADRRSYHVCGGHLGLHCPGGVENPQRTGATVGGRATGRDGQGEQREHVWRRLRLHAQQFGVLTRGPDA